MDCEYIKKLIPIYLDDELDSEEKEEVQRHLMECAGCQAELQSFGKSWEMLEEWQDIEPRPDYLSQFWTRVSFETSWAERFLLGLKEVFSRKKFAVAFSMVSIVLIVGFLSFLNYFRIQRSEQLLAEMTSEEIEIISDIEFVEDLEIIEDYEFLADLDFLEELETSES